MLYIINKFVYIPSQYFIFHHRKSIAKCTAVYIDGLYSLINKFQFISVEFWMCNK